MSINTVTVSGNLTRDPELRMNANGTAFLNLGIAVNENRKSSQGEWEPYTHYVDCVVVGRRAEGLASFMRKGMKVAIEGKLSWKQWETPEGGKRSKLSILADEIDVMSPRRDNEASGGVADPSRPTSPPPPTDEIPF